MSKLFRLLIINPLLSVFTIIIIIHRSFSNDFELPTVEMVRHHGYKSAEIYKVTTSDGFVLELHRIPKSLSGNDSFRKYPVLIPNIYMGSSADWVKMVRNHGYTSAEVYKVTTSDGFVLELHRIPKSLSGNNSFRKYPVLIPNIYMGSSADWVIGGPEKSLPEQLADSGYDVWLGNYRGNTYSRKHKRFKPTEYDFWDFSMQELGEIDLPEMIDFILTETNKKKLYFVGLSMSSTIFFIMGSEKPLYQEKIVASFLLGPVANIRNTTSSFKLIAAVAKYINALVRVINHGEFLPFTRKGGNFMRRLCRHIFTKHVICLRLLLWAACGKDQYYFDESLMPYIFGHYPAGSSSKLVQHYSQSIMTDGFTKYDYGPRLNEDKYGTKHPPPYDLKKVTAPTYIFRADNDLLANPQDTDSLEKQLPNVKSSNKLDNSYFNHADFIFGLLATELVYNPIKDIMQKCEDSAGNDEF